MKPRKFPLEKTLTGFYWGFIVGRINFCSHNGPGNTERCKRFFGNIFYWTICIVEINVRQRQSNVSSQVLGKKLFFVLLKLHQKTDTFLQKTWF